MAEFWGSSSKVVHEYQRLIFEGLPESYLKEYSKRHDEIIANPLFAEDIHWWSHGGDQKINAVLRKGEAAHPIFEAIIANIVYAIDQMPPIPAPITLYRGMVLKKFRTEKLRVGDVIEDLGFTAFSSLKKVAHRFADLDTEEKAPCCLFTVTIPAGTKLLHIFPTSYIAEREVIVMPGSKIRVDEGLKVTGEYAATLAGFAFDATKKYDLSFSRAVIDNLDVILKKWKPVAIKGNYMIIVDGTVNIPIKRVPGLLSWRRGTISSVVSLGSKMIHVESDIYVYCAIIHLLQEGHTVEFQSNKLPSLKKAKGASKKPKHK